MTLKEKPPKGSVSLTSFLDQCDKIYLGTQSNEQKKSFLRNRIKEFVSRDKIDSFKKPGKNKNSMEFILEDSQEKIRNIYKNLYFLRKKGIYLISLNDLSNDLDLSLQQVRRIFRVYGQEYLLSEDNFSQLHSEFFLKNYDCLNIKIRKSKRGDVAIIPYFKYIDDSSKKFVSSNIRRDLKICLNNFLKDYDTKKEIFEVNWYNDFTNLIKEYNKSR